MINVAATICFAAFVLLALVAWRGGSSRRSARPLIAGAVTLILAVGIAQYDLWPFSAWPLIALYHPPEAKHIRLACIDDRGAEHPVDSRAVAPISYLELMSWADGVFPRLPLNQQREAAQWIVDRLETSRRRIAATGEYPRAAAPLGPLTSPFFIFAPRLWMDGGMPSRPIIGVRLYRDSWNLEERAKNDAAITRALLYEYRSDAEAPK